jgi:uncharacterized protein (DUF433 family)
MTLCGVSSAVRRPEPNSEGVSHWYTLSMELAERVTVNPAQCGGRPCIRGMRIRVTDVLDLFAAGLSPEQILAEMPDLELEDLQASLRYAARSIDHPVLVA